ncbi:MAG: M48 family metalloprotease [Gemmatimonadota bacterium]
MELSLGLALLPALVAWWGGRRLAAHLADPSFPDLLQAHRARVQLATVAVGVSGTLLVDGFGWGHVALTVAGALVGGFPARRRIFDEQWTLAGYVLHLARVALAFFGAALPLLFVPAIVVRRPDFYVWLAPVAVALSAVLAFDSRVLLRVLSARPLEDTGLRQRFAALVERATVDMPRLLLMTAPGGRWVNAFALPHPGRQAVLLTEGLLEGLEPGEVDAIFAHEVAHLEEFTPKRWFWRSLPLPLATALEMAAIGVIGPDSDVMVWVGGILPWVLLAAMGMAAAGIRGRETASDLRAAELTGDPELVIRALEKLHALNHQPRRLAARVERHATHPSLARRAQAIREHAGLRGEAPVVGSLAVRNADDPRKAVRLQIDRIEWFEDLPLEEGPLDDLVLDASSLAAAFPYDRLTEVRVHAPRAQHRSLMVRREDGSQWKHPLAAEDAARVQAFLDSIDHKLASATAEARASWYASPSLVRVAALIALLVAATVYDGASLLNGLVALIWPLAFTLASTGAALLIGAILRLLRALAGGDALLLPGLHAGVGLALFLLAWVRTRRGRGDPVRQRERAALVLVLCGGLGIALALVMSSGPGQGMHLYLWAKSTPGTLITLASAGAALLLVPSRPARSQGILIMLFAVAWGAVGTDAFRSRFAGDVLSTAGPRIVARSGGMDPIRAVSLPDWPSALSVSPAGSRLAALMSGEWDEPDGTGSEWPSGYLVEAEGDWKEVPGFDLGWLSENDVVSLAWAEEGYALHHTDLAADIVTTLPLDVEGAPTLAVDEDGWAVWEIREGAEVVRHAGRAQGSEVSTSHWTLPAAALPAAVNVESATTGSVLITRTAVPLSTMSGAAGMLAFLRALSSQSEVWIVDGAGVHELGRTALRLMCGPAVGVPGRHLCAAPVADRAEFWAFEASARRPVPLGRLGGWTEPSWMADHGLAIQRLGKPPLLVDGDPFVVRVPEPSTAQATVPTYGPSQWWDGVVALSYRPGVAALVRWSADSANVVVYRAPADGGARGALP